VPTTLNVPYNYHVRVDLTVKLYTPATASTTSKTYSFVQKSLKNSSTQNSFWPLLTDLGEVSFNAGEFLPSSSFSSFSIDNRPGTFGLNRKFSDILERYSPVEQSVAVYTAKLATDSDTVSSWTQVFQGICTRWSSSIEDGAHSLTFEVRPVRYREKVLTLEVNRTVSGMANAPDSSLGRAVPLIIGDNQEVIPIRITADGATEPRYAVGTCLYQLTKNRLTWARVYTKDNDNKWALVDTTANTDYSGTTPAGSYSLNQYNSRAWKLNINSVRIITGVQLRAKGNGTGTVSTAKLTVFIMVTMPGGGTVIDERAAVATLDLSIYDTQNNAGTTNFPINVSFDRPLYLDANYEYFLGYEATGVTADDLTIHYGSGNTIEYRKDGTDAGTNGNDSYAQYKVVFPSTRILYKLHETTYSFTEHVEAYTPAGLTYSRLDLTQFTPDSGQQNPHFDNFPILVALIRGQCTYSGGALYTSTADLVKVLGYNWNGTAWTDPTEWDTTTLSTHYWHLYDINSVNARARTPRGVFDSRITYTDFLTEVCRGTASRVGTLPNGKMFMYPWGISHTVTAKIPNADLIPLGWRQEGVETVMSRVTANGFRGYRFTGRDFENGRADNQDGFGYQFSEDFNGTDGLYPPVAAMTAEARALYGDLPPAETNYTISPFPADVYALDNGYLGNGSSSARMSLVAEYLLARYGRPLTYAEFRVPWSKYSAIKLFDVIEFTSTEFPAFYGTNPDGTDAVVTDGTVGRATSAQGYELVVSHTYRGLVESVTYQLPLGHSPMIRLTVLVLRNQQFDPT
jgi:hypothetical protein